MKYLKKLPLLIIVGVIAFGFVSCTKQGPQGPIGPQGSQGPAGPVGDTGPRGTSGKVASIKTYYSDWIPSVNFEKENGHYVGIFDAPKITSDVIDNGTVVVYYLLNDKYVYTLPYLTTYKGGTRVNFKLKAGKLIIFSNVHFTSSFAKFRYTIFPGR